MVNPFGKKLNREQAIQARANLDGLFDSPGFAFLREHWLKRAEDLRRPQQINFESVKSVLADAQRANVRLAEADVIADVFQWVEDAVAYCDRAIGGNGNDGTGEHP